MEKLLKNFFNNTNIEENRDILCDVCNQYLSVPPIFYNVHMGNICGRCDECPEVVEIKKSRNKNSIMERQKVFESVARFLLFPCSYQKNGCDAELKWEEVNIHEQNCIFKTTVCLLSNKDFLEDDQDPCQWAGKSTQLLSHIFAKHKLYFNSSLRIVLGLEASSIFGPLFGTDTISYEPKFQSKLLFTEAFGSLVIIVLYYHQRINRYFCHMLSDLPNFKCRSLEYQLKIYDENRKNFISLPKSTIQSMKNYFLHRAIDENALEIDLNYINKLLKKPHFITADFQLLKKNVQSMRIHHMKNLSSSSSQSFDETFLENMKCSMCKIYFSKSIFFCINGHNICEKCKMECREKCFICKSSWSRFKNVALEKLSHVVKYPCKNKSVGCTYSAPMPQITEHEELCRDTRRCYFQKCDWRGENFKSHVREKHAFLVTNDLYQVKTQKSFFSLDEDVFALEMEYSLDNYFRFSVINCGSEELKYSYEIQLLDSRVDLKPTPKLTFDHICQPEFTSFTPESVRITVPFNLLPQMFSNCSKIMFRINVFPISENV